MDDQAIGLVKEVFEQWALYEAIVQHNYMRHADLKPLLHDVFAHVPRPLKILDLGCGDGWLGLNACEGLELESYLGIDLSESALSRAAALADGRAVRAEFICGDIARHVSEIPQGRANVVLTSYSLHHLSSPAKSELLGQCRRIVGEGGAVVLIDVVRNEQETRDEYLTRMTSYIRDEWRELTPEQRTRAVEHIWASDFPETEDWLLEQAEKQGLTLRQRLFRDSYFGGWLLRA